ncbi:MAG: hypothetical protein ACOYOK_09140 [Pseudobdellovibrionaceae bacterium]
MNKFCIHFIAFFTILNCSYALAADGVANGKNWLVGSIGAGVSAGTIGNSSGSIQKRSITSTSVIARIGLLSGFLEPFVMGEYMYSLQSTPASLAENTNMGGRGYVAGGGLGLHINNLTISGALLPSGTYTLMQSNSAGEQVIYTEPVGVRFRLSYKFNSWLTGSAFYRNLQFTKSTTAGTTSDIGDDRLSHVNTGLALEWGF